MGAAVRPARAAAPTCGSPLAYVVAVENGTEAAWRLEDIAERTGHDLLAAGDARAWNRPRGRGRGAGRALPALYTPTATPPPDPDAPTRRASRGARRVEPGSGEGTSAAIQRRLDDQVVVYASRGPAAGGCPRCTTASGSRISPTPEPSGSQERRELAGRAPYAISPSAPRPTATPRSPRSRSVRITPRRTRRPRRGRAPRRRREQLADEHATPETIVEVLHAAGCTPATAVQVLRARRSTPATWPGCCPPSACPWTTPSASCTKAGRCPPSGRRSPRATAAEMRAAGCTPGRSWPPGPRGAPHPSHRPRHLGGSGDHHGRRRPRTPRSSPTWSHMPQRRGLRPRAQRRDGGARRRHHHAVRYGAQPTTSPPRPRPTASPPPGRTSRRRRRLQAGHRRNRPRLCDQDLDLTTRSPGPPSASTPARSPTCSTHRRGHATDRQPRPTDTNSLLATYPTPNRHRSRHDRSWPCSPSPAHPTPSRDARGHP